MTRVILAAAAVLIVGIALAPAQAERVRLTLAGKVRTVIAYRETWRAERRKAEKAKG